MLQAEANQIGYSLLVKAIMGGEGKGMKLARTPSQCREAVESAQREAAASFGDPRVLLERYIEVPRHIEVQVRGVAARVRNLPQSYFAIEERKAHTTPYFSLPHAPCGLQVVGDQYGAVVHLFERDCSIQRRHQKVIEEAPAAKARRRVCSITRLPCPQTRLPSSFQYVSDRSATPSGARSAQLRLLRLARSYTRAPEPWSSLWTPRRASTSSWR